jgi:hypothetical protein
MGLGVIADSRAGGQAQDLRQPGLRTVRLMKPKSFRRATHWGWAGPIVPSRVGSAQRRTAGAGHLLAASPGIT